MNLLFIYAEFFKIGLFAVGGGLAALPFLFQLADRSGWLSREMVGNYIAIAQSAPGAIGVNVAAQTGFQYAGIAGAFLAALGLVSPAIAVIALVSRFLQLFRENRAAASVFSGLRPAASGLLCAAGLGALKLSLYNQNAALWRQILRWRECAIFAALFVLLLKFRGRPIVYIALGAIAGIVLGL